MNNDYELAYKGIPKVTIVLRGLCFKCGRPVKTEGRIPEGVHWDSTSECGKCGYVQIVTIHIKNVETS